MHWISYFFFFDIFKNVNIYIWYKQKKALTSSPAEPSSAAVAEQTSAAVAEGTSAAAAGGTPVGSRVQWPPSGLRAGKVTYFVSHIFYRYKNTCQTKNNIFVI